MARGNTLPQAPGISTDSSLQSSVPSSRKSVPTPVSPIDGAAAGEPTHSLPCSPSQSPRVTATRRGLLGANHASPNTLVFTPLIELDTKKTMLSHSVDVQEYEGAKPRMPIDYVQVTPSPDDGPSSSPLTLPNDDDGAAIGTANVASRRSPAELGRKTSASRVGNRMILTLPPRPSSPSATPKSVAAAIATEQDTRSASTGRTRPRPLLRSASYTPPGSERQVLSAYSVASHPTTGVRTVLNTDEQHPFSGYDARENQDDDDDDDSSERYIRSEGERHRHRHGSRHHHRHHRHHHDALLDEDEERLVGSDEHEVTTTHEASLSGSSSSKSGKSHKSGTRKRDKKPSKKEQRGKSRTPSADTVTLSSRTTLANLTPTTPAGGSQADTPAPVAPSTTTTPLPPTPVISNATGAGTTTTPASKKLPSNPKARFTAEPSAPLRETSSVFDSDGARATISLSRIPGLSIAETDRIQRAAQLADLKRSWRVSLGGIIPLLVSFVSFYFAIQYEMYDLALATCLALSGSLLWTASLIPDRYRFWRQCYIAAAFSSCYLCATVLALCVVHSSGNEEEATTAELGMIWFFVLLTLACFIGSLRSEAWFLALVAVIGGLTAPFLLADYYNLIAMVIYSSCITGTGMVLFVYHARSACGQLYFHALPFVVAITGWIVCFIQNLLVVNSLERYVVRAAIVVEWLQFWLVPLYVYFSYAEHEPSAAYIMELTVLFFTVASGGVACLLLSFTAYSFVYWSGWALVMGLLYAIASSVLEANLKRPLISWIHYGFALSLTTISITMLFRGNMKHMLLAIEAFVITLISAINERFLGLVGGLGMWAYVLFKSAYVLVFSRLNGTPLLNPDALANATVLAILSLQSHLMPNLSKVIFEAVVHAYLTMLLYHEFEFYPNLLYVCTALYPVVLQWYAHYRLHLSTSIEAAQLKRKKPLGASTFLSLGLDVLHTEFHIRIVYGYGLWLWVIVSQTLPRLLLLPPCDPSVCTPILNANAITAITVPIIVIINSFIIRDFIVAKWTYRVWATIVAMLVVLEELRLISIVQTSL